MYNHSGSHKTTEVFRSFCGSLKLYATVKLRRTSSSTQKTRDSIINQHYPALFDPLFDHE